MQKLKPLSRRLGRQGGPQEMADPIINRLEIDKTSAPMILIIGETGAGKSHFCNKVLGEDVDEVEESRGLASCTSKPQLVSAMVDNREYLLIDTPGFNDTWRAFKRSDATILGEIAQALILQTQLGVKLRGILYLYDISHNRMTGDTMRQFELIKRVCGEHNYQNVLLVTTRWPRLVEDYPLCAVREGELRRDFWREMIAGGSAMSRFDNTHATAKAIVRRLAAKDDITLTLQDELAAGKGLKRTAAFSFIVNARCEDEAEMQAEETEAAGPGRAEGVAIRKEAEAGLTDDIVAKVQRAIEEEDANARRKQKRLNVQQLFRWILGLTHVAMGGAQVGLAAAA